MTTVSRRARLVDLGSLASILAGAALCYAASVRFQDISKLSYRHPGPRTESALAAADRARYIAYAGIGLIIVGCVIGAGGAIRLARRKTPG